MTTFVAIMELTNNLRKLVASLSERKHRKKENLFKAEGTKCVVDTLPHFKCFALFATEQWLAKHNREVENINSETVVCATAADIRRMSSLTTPQDVIAVYEIPSYELDLSRFEGSLLLALDSVQDPGNLGTIIRTADWFGITDILCSRETADVFAPKVVQATMGAISKVRLHYCDLHSALTALSKSMPVYGTFLSGENIYRTELSESAVIVMGNEGNGISDEIASLVNSRILIPSFAGGCESSESLNVATATAITVSEFRRRTISM